ncbi:HIG1 domain-containing protein [Emcibacter nanhaiensis]|uniref:HIG1 domain-containing protein n=1 Tax=Emcibacter nanhaiensis TaxID=1505037 RepID=A0A501PPN7_9PROT|nr:HIG1 domain-containing protein [Emcibacter nanhaiensis]TPD61756.1 HIG1 domain-containing protein [Emcibacter nanhaiensis]
MLILKLLIILGIIVTGGIMLLGVASMSKGGDFNKKHGNQLMRARIIAQFVTLLLIAIYLLAYG